MLVQVPIMLRSSYCSLAEHSEKELQELGECPYDQARAPGLAAFPYLKTFSHMEALRAYIHSGLF